MKKNKNKKINIKNILKKYYYFAIPVGVLIVCIITIVISKNMFNKTEKQAYDMVYGIKNEFKNPDAVKVLSVKLCNDEYGIIKISSTNSFGGIVTKDYYINKANLFDSDDKPANGIVDKCFELEKNDYDSIHVLSKKSIDKINKKLKGSK